jgi:hypothetical protein
MLPLSNSGVTMKALVGFVFAVACILPNVSQAAGLVVTDAQIGGGKLIVTGTSPLANQSIELDGRFTTMSDAQRKFSFSVVYVPADCIVQVAAGSVTRNAAVARCAVGQPRGVVVHGAVSLSGIPNGRCNQVTFNVGGAVVGDSVIVSTGAAIQNGMLMYASRVSSAGHVEVNACNFSGASMTPISDFPVKIMTFP